MKMKNLILAAGMMLAVGAVGTIFSAIGGSNKVAETTAIKTETVAVAETTIAIMEEIETKSATTGEENAVRAANDYLDIMSFSAKELKEQLEFDGYKANEVQYALDNCIVDYKAEAYEAAEDYLSIMSFSKSELKEQLEYDGFEVDEVDFALQMTY